jgi:hypothetical protein
MTDISFRLHFRLPDTSALSIDKNSIDLSQISCFPLSLKSENPKETIHNSKDLVLIGSGFESEEIAYLNGQRFRDVLTISLSHCRIGAEFGDRMGQGGFTKDYLNTLEKNSGQRILNDTIGLMIYKTFPPPAIAKFGQPTLTPLTSFEKFQNAFSYASSVEFELSQQQRLSFTLFSASFFEKSPEARLLFLVMSIEVLLEFQSRPSKVVQYVNEFIDRIKESDLEKSEMDSLVNSMGYLKKESIQQAAKHLIKIRLGEKEYSGQKAIDFFTYCYGLRSKLVHGGKKYPAWNEIGAAAAGLEVLVADLISSSINWKTD